MSEKYIMLKPLSGGLAKLNFIPIIRMPITPLESYYQLNNFIIRIEK